MFLLLRREIQNTVRCVSGDVAYSAWALQAARRALQEKQGSNSKPLGLNVFRKSLKVVLATV